MPKHTQIRIVAVTLAFALTGCASAPRTEGGGYTESSVDVRDRAPASVAIPKSADYSMEHESPRAKADFHFALGEAYALEGNPARALEEYRMVLVHDPESVQVRLRLAAEYVKQNMVAEAVAQVKAAVEKSPEHVEARMMLGGLYSALRMFDSAEEQYKHVIKRDPNHYDALMFVAALYAEQRRFEEAGKRFESLAKAEGNTNAHLAWYYLGRVRLEGNKMDKGGKAEAALLKAISLKPGFHDSVLALAQLYEESNRRPKAVELLHAHQAKHGPASTLAESLAQYYLQDEKFAEALEQLKIVEASDSEDLGVRVKIAYTLIQTKSYKEAILRLEELISKMPTADKLRFYLGAVYEEVKDYRSAIPHFLKIPTGSSYYVESRVHAAYLHKLIGDVDKAVTTIEAAIEESPEHEQFYALYASLLDDQGSHKKSLDMLKSAVERFPKNAQLRFYLGSVFDKLGDKKSTLEWMRRVIELDQDHVQALNYLAYSLAEEEQSLVEAEELAKRAVSLKGDDGYIVDTLGWVYFKQGKFEQAVKTLEQAHQLQPDEAIIADHLGDAYYRFRMPERAKRVYEKAVGLAEREIQRRREAGQSGVEVGVSPERIRAKILIVDRQIEELARENERRPASR
jgi:tetratricopeptide (TPR) repeat protein